MQYSGADTKRPILIDSTFSQPSRLQLNFRPMGKYAASTYTSHIRIPFNYSSLMDLQHKMNDRLNNFFDYLQEWNFSIDNETEATFRSIFKLCEQNTDEIFKLFKDLLESLPHVHERQRRQWDVVAMATSAAALSLATYNTVQISKLETAIEAQQAKTDLLTDISKLHENHLHKLDNMVDDIGKELQVIHFDNLFKVKVERVLAQVNADEHKLRAVIAVFERLIHSAYDKKLAPGALSTDVLHQILFHIDTIANKNSFEKFVHEPADLYNLEVSFIHRPEEQTIILILHVPFVEAQKLLPLYEFVSLPIHFNFSANISVVPDVGRADLIAIGDTETFQTLSSSDLAGCRRLGQTFFCSGSSVLQTNLVHDCLGSLFLGTATLIKTNCKFRISDTREKIFSLGNNTWLVYSVGTIATNHYCPKTGVSTPLTIASGHTVRVQPGCLIQTMDHVITAEDSDEFEIKTTWLDWTMTLAQLFDHEDTEQLMNIIRDIRSTISGTFDASELLQRLESLNKPFQSHHWLFSSPAAMIAILLLIALVYFIAYKKCCRKSSHSQTDKTSPSATLPPPSDVFMEELATLRDYYQYMNRPGTHPRSIPVNKPPPSQNFNIPQQNQIALPNQVAVPKAITFINS